MPDTEVFEYVDRAVEPNGRVLSATNPRPHPSEWAHGVGMVLVRSRHPNAILERLRRPLGSDEPWQVWDRREPSVPVEETTDVPM